MIPSMVNAMSLSFALAMMDGPARTARPVGNCQAVSMEIAQRVGQTLVNAEKDGLVISVMFQYAGNRKEEFI